MLAWLALVLAACRPQWLGEPLSLPLTGRSLLLALDVSASMRQLDAKPSDTAAQTLANTAQTRLQVVKRTARAFIERRSGDRVGLVLFGSRAYLQCPLTFDTTTVANTVDGVTVGLAGELTSIGEAIGLGVSHLARLPDHQRVLVLLTDGANTAGRIEPLHAAQLAREHGVRVHTIGVGASSEMQSFAPDHALLERIAKLSGGEHFVARDASALAQIYTILDQLEPVTRGEQRLRAVRDVYYWPLAFALLLTVLIVAGKLSTRAGSRAALTPVAIEDPNTASARHG